MSASFPGPAQCIVWLKNPPSAEGAVLNTFMHAPSAKPLILIADDRPSSRELLRTVLERAGYDVIEAEDGEEAWEQARSRRPDLILLDLQMPRLDGYGVMERLRADPGIALPPVLALTASAMRGDREKILAAGFTEYLSKPAGAEALRETVARLLDQGTGRGARGSE